MLAQKEVPVPAVGESTPAAAVLGALGWVWRKAQGQTRPEGQVLTGAMDHSRPDLQTRKKGAAARRPGRTERPRVPKDELHG
jgi:hypothetical protein